MKLPQSGGCQCGKVRYAITEEPQLIYTCHCLDCPRLTSSAFSLAIVVPENGFRLMGVEPRRLQRTADSGRVNTRLVCPECGSWVCGTPRDGMDPRPRRHAGRYLLAAAHKAHLDSPETAVGDAPRER